jgi:hypothetical protein
MARRERLCENHFNKKVEVGTPTFPPKRDSVFYLPADQQLFPYLNLIIFNCDEIDAIS